MVKTNKKQLQCCEVWTKTLLYFNLSNHLCLFCLCLRRLLCSLCPGLSVLRAAVHVFGCGGVSGVWTGWGWMLWCCSWRLLLLCGGSGGGGMYGGGVSGCVGLWDTGELLRLLRLLGDLSGVLLHLLPLIEQPITEGLQDNVGVNRSCSDLVPGSGQTIIQTQTNTCNWIFSLFRPN